MVIFSFNVWKPCKTIIDFVEHPSMNAPQLYASRVPSNGCNQPSKLSVNRSITHTNTVNISGHKTVATFTAATLKGNTTVATFDLLEFYVIHFVHPFRSI